ncbi:MAG: pyridoxal 5'-phosphate synthase, partial [Candidatus Marinimicrobia bacterium]|nr:pyridoxal 5'-phosphate synthase [Candidatus Neomarinimicrobiota bacterium]
MSLWTQLCGWPGIHRGLTEQDLDPDPVQQFQRWLRFAARAGCHWPNAMCLATVGADGAPAARMVLLKDCNVEGFSFYTHINGRKGRELAARPAAALVFHWVELQRQVRIEGAAEPLPRETAPAYFATRPRLSQLGAWASRQSEP